MKVLGKYRNGNYIVTILEDGTKIRATKDDDFVPAFSENCDCKITDKCSQNCAFCYEGCVQEREIMVTCSHISSLSHYIHIQNLQ